MKKDLIKKNYLIKIKSIQKLNRFYYDESKPILSDADYDKLKVEILELEKKIYLFKKF